jgi:hypothetical protein
MDKDMIIPAWPRPRRRTLLGAYDRLIDSRGFLHHLRQQGSRRMPRAVRCQAKGNT